MKRLGRLYLVLNPTKDWDELLTSLHQALKGGVGIVQVWDHWAEEVTDSAKGTLLVRIKELADKFQVAVLLNEDWELALAYGLDGVHFDRIPEDWDKAKIQLRKKLIGITVGNDLETVRWANENRLAYISFCSVFPSSSVDTCEIVLPGTIKKAREMTDIPIFLSGGIRLENLPLLERYSYEGIAVISGILNEENPREAANAYLKQLKSKP
jgi:thiamine-phosphate pyrophosphorylase